MGARVILNVRPGLCRLMRALDPQILVIEAAADGGLIEAVATPAFDYYCLISSLPRAFGVRLGSIYAPTRYLMADEARVALWRHRLGTRGLTIGICWQGTTASFKLGRGRYESAVTRELSSFDRGFPLRALQPLATLPNVRLISLQKFEGLDQLATLPAGMRVETLEGDFDEGPHRLLDAAAVISELDLVVTCDTAIAHLAGALGRPTWVALQYVPDWRWMLEGEASPWYPTLRLFRQGADRRWDSVFADMRDCLRIEAHPGSSPLSN
jgi:hypothetical protein